MNRKLPLRKRRSEESSGSQAEYDAKVAADQALLDKRVSESTMTGDAEQRAERQVALDLEAQSERDAKELSEEEKQREREAAEKLAADSAAGGTVAANGEVLAFDYDAYMRGVPIPCTVGEWTEWAKVGDLVEETETVEYRSGVRGRGTRTREESTGRWQQRWKRERELLSPALNGGTCVTEDFKFTTQASRNCRIPIGTAGEMSVNLMRKEEVMERNGIKIRNEIVKQLLSRMDVI